MEGGVAVGEGAAREGGKRGRTVDQGGRLGAAMGLDQADEDIGAGGELAAGGDEHGVGFAHAGSHAEEECELAARGGGLGAAGGGEKGVGVGPRRVGN